jgi:hypothetical protein
MPNGRVGLPVVGVVADESWLLWPEEGEPCPFPCLAEWAWTRAAGQDHGVQQGRLLVAGEAEEDERGREEGWTREPRREEEERQGWNRDR